MDIHGYGSLVYGYPLARIFDLWISMDMDLLFMDIHGYGLEIGGYPLTWIRDLWKSIDSDLLYDLCTSIPHLDLFNGFLMKRYE